MSRDDYAFPCAGCLCDHCANNLYSSDKMAGEAKIFCYVCEECRYYDGDLKNKDMRCKQCENYIVTNEHAERLRKVGNCITLQARDKNEVYDRITVLHATERALIGEIIMDVNVHEIIVLRDKKVQARTHKKKRINKKWAKRYGFKTYENQLIENGQMIVMGREIYMNERTYKALKKHVR